MKVLTNRVLGLGLMLVLALAVEGCGTSYGRYDVVVSMDPALTSQPGGAPSVAVHIIGVNNDTSVGELSAKSMSEYWKPGDKFKQDLAGSRYEMSFGPRDSGPKTLKKTDPIWGKWDRPVKLFILADLPGAHSDQPGDLDGRRKSLPLETSRWDGDRIEIQIQRSRIQVLTKMNPEKK